MGWGRVGWGWGGWVGSGVGWEKGVGWALGGLGEGVWGRGEGLGWWGGGGGWPWPIVPIAFFWPYPADPGYPPRGDPMSFPRPPNVTLLVLLNGGRPLGHGEKAK